MLVSTSEAHRKGSEFKLCDGENSNERSERLKTWGLPSRTQAVVRLSGGVVCKPDGAGKLQRPVSWSPRSLCESSRNTETLRPHVSGAAAFSQSQGRKSSLLSSHKGGTRVSVLIPRLVLLCLAFRRLKSVERIKIRWGTV